MRIGQVAWLDACCYHNVDSLHDLDGPMLMMSTGIVVNVEGDGVYLAQDVDEQGKLRNVLFIPQAYIVKEEYWDADDMLEEEA